jgi:lipid-A-disaccharide synthase-like uncharacterized protein
MAGWGDSTFWLMLGLTAQAAFFSRFLVQWVASERAGRSIVPVAFWYLSLGGSLMLLVYAIHRMEPVFALGQSVGGIVYIRNLILLKRRGDSVTVAAREMAGGRSGGDHSSGDRSDRR